MLLNEKYNQTFGIKVKKGWKVLLDEKHDQMFGIIVRKVLPDEKHDQTFEIKYYQTKNMTRFLELSITRQKI
ncbi:hypothetical protein RclHR1_02940016 [Rhizophagus clarus]|uniref:Uncharacterized protein n=1 Tax=Rhizophagus clarus TaxID=94130 RepID=A0A2Z6RGQ9_9GLOM|nr:hypothetical protein RclHR1_02940016 [Rhizophagus clarus]